MTQRPFLLPSFVSLLGLSLSHAVQAEDLRCKYRLHPKQHDDAKELNEKYLACKAYGAQRQLVDDEKAPNRAVLGIVTENDFQCVEVQSGAFPTRDRDGKALKHDPKTTAIYVFDDNPIAVMNPSRDLKKDCGKGLFEKHVVGNGGSSPCYAMPNEQLVRVLVDRQWKDCDAIAKTGTMRANVNEDRKVAPRLAELKNALGYANVTPRKSTGTASVSTPRSYDGNLVKNLPGGSEDPVHSNEGQNSGHGAGEVNTR